MAHILLVDNALSHALYRPLAHWRLAVPEEVPITCVHALSEVLPLDLSPFSHVIISGSEASICQRDDWAEREAVWLREEVVGKGLPVLGSCWGHQLMAYALAGEEAIGRAPEPELGWIEVEVLDPSDPLIGPLVPRFTVLNLHFDEVRVLAPGFVATARSAGCAIQAMRHQTLPFFGLQSHPETPVEAGLFFLEDLTRRQPPAGDIARRALTEGPKGEEVVRGMMSRFLEIRYGVYLME